MDPVQKVLEVSGFSQLNPVQQLAVDSGLLDKGNMVVSAPTASGKTLLSEIAALETISKGGKVVYIVPLKALASEKYSEFKEKYEPLGIKVAISVGDMDSSDSWLGNYDIIIATSEKLDSLLRHEAAWSRDIGLIIVDEIHLLNSPNRGPTLEIVLTRLRQVVNPKILGLSATISNYDELAAWLDAKPVKSDYRPVKLYRGIFYDNELSFVPDKDVPIGSSSDPVINLVYHTLDINKQALIFLSTRRNAEATAEKIGASISRRLKLDDRGKLVELSERVGGALDHPTRQCERLAKCVATGTAFHHAGLSNKQRKLIESGFKSGAIKVLTATPTLAAGVNLPAYRVIIRDLKRFAQFRGMDYLPVMEVEQMCGRAGRPAFDKEGEAILIPKNQGEARYCWDNYIQGESEKIYSKLGVEPVLRTHVLALIASGVCQTKQELFNFFSKTFYAFQYEDFDSLKSKLEKVLGLLQKFEFIKIGGMGTSIDGNAGFHNPFTPASDLVQDEDLKPTKIGKRVSELYIDPITANKMVESLGKIGEDVRDFGLLHVICGCLEMKPLLSIKKGDEEYINEVLLERLKDIVEKPPNEWDIEYEDYLGSIKTAAFLQSWIEERGEDHILEKFGVTPGELRARIDIADWLLYALHELCVLLGNMGVLKEIKKARIRMKNGIREELLALIKIKGIGRVKARSLFNSKIKDVGDLRNIPMATLSQIVGQKTAEKIKEQV